MKRFLLALLALLAASPALARELVGTNPGWDPGATWFFVESTGAVDDFSRPVDVCPTTSLTAELSSTAIVSVYATIPADDTVAEIEARPKIATIGSDQPTAFILNGAANQIRFVVDTKETASPATWIRFFCNESAGGSSVATQARPSTFTESDRLTQDITDPQTARFGFGVATEGYPTGFQGLRYPGGPDGDEPNNMMGVYYNKLGVYSSTIPNPFETSFECNWELAYRTAATGEETWIEENCDFRTPDFTVTTTGSSGTFLVGDTLSYSGGGSARVLSASGSNPTQTLTVRNDFGTTAVGQTITNVSRAGSGTIATLTSTPGAPFRPYLFVYKSLSNTASFDWYTGYGTYPTVTISTVNLSVRGQNVVAGGNNTTNGPAVWAISNAGTVSIGNEVCGAYGLTCVDVIDFTTIAVPADSNCTAEIANNGKFLAMCR